MNGYTHRNGMWFGTQERAQWIPAPLQGADTSPSGWGANGTFLNGGSFSRNSWGSHKTYTFEWNTSSSPETAQLMHSYANGSFGRGPLYFVDPLTYRHNVLPARWADPSITLDLEGRPLRTDMTIESVPTAGGVETNLPTQSVQFSRAAGQFGDGQPYPGDSQSVFIPIPAGMYLAVTAWYQSEGDMHLAIAPVGTSGVPQYPFTIVENDTTELFPSSNLVYSSNNVVGARLYIWDNDGMGSSNRSVTVAGIRARLFPIDTPHNPGQIEWMGGMGHSGCQFLGRPQMQSISPFGPGRMAFAAQFTEVGDWIYA